MTDTETPVTLTTKTGALHGTLLIPNGARSPMPIALIVFGFVPIRGSRSTS